jgi:hypothetical protein
LKHRKRIAHGSDLRVRESYAELRPAQHFRLDGCIAFEQVRDDRVVIEVQRVTVALVALPNLAALEGVVVAA